MLLGEAPFTSPQRALVETTSTGEGTAEGDNETAKVEDSEVEHVPNSGLHFVPQ